MMTFTAIQTIFSVIKSVWCPRSLSSAFIKYFLKCIYSEIKGSNYKCAVITSYSSNTIAFRVLSFLNECVCVIRFIKVESILLEICVNESQTCKLILALMASSPKHSNFTHPHENILWYLIIYYGVLITIYIVYL